VKLREGVERRRSQRFRFVQVPFFFFFFWKPLRTAIGRLKKRNAPHHTNRTKETRAKMRHTTHQHKRARPSLPFLEARYGSPPRPAMKQKNKKKGGTAEKEQRRAKHAPKQPYAPRSNHPTEREFERAHFRDYDDYDDETNNNSSPVEHVHSLRELRDAYLADVHSLGLGHLLAEATTRDGLDNGGGSSSPRANNDGDGDVPPRCGPLGE
jgi:hypothetical protein